MPSSNGGSASPPAEPPADTTSEATATSKSPNSSQTKKRSGSTSPDQNATTKVTKRRAARACVSCRARKVRCDVVEGAPCGNCRWDGVTCVVQESRRRKKNIFVAASNAAVEQQLPGAEALRSKSVSINPINITSADLRSPSNVSAMSMSGIDNGGGAGMLDSFDGHVPHLLYQRSGYQPEAAAGLLAELGETRSRFPWSYLKTNPRQRFGDFQTAQFPDTLEEPDLSQLPAFIKPLPEKIGPDDVKYLHVKGALVLPSLTLQNALLRAYVEFVHPYMPLMEIHDFLNCINARDGQRGQVSLLLYQAVMFTATAFVQLKHLNEAGYSTRKAARKAFFQKTRLLYDFDYESDRLVLVQALLLMTYWYETPDDQKDTWHWMGVAISLAHTIGLHRNPINANMTPSKRKLWKRIWWSCFMRDRLIALGMRRPTRIKDEDFDVPMLEESDFEIDVLSDEIQVLPPECTVLRDTGMQEELAQMCVQKARLCVLISHMLKAQYSVLIRDRNNPEATTNSTMMLFPNKALDNLDRVNMVDVELAAWVAALPAACQYRPLAPTDIENGRSTIAVQRNLLHMVYQTTISALHRPQFMPASPMQPPPASSAVQEICRRKVKSAAIQITRMAAELHELGLELFLPTTGVTVILPAMIIHLLELKSPIQECRGEAEKGFSQCMRVMIKLREIYAAADFATGFLDAALRKANMTTATTAHPAHVNTSYLTRPATPPPDGDGSYLNTMEACLFAQKQSSSMTKMGRPQLASMSGGLAHSPPHTERDLGLTPSASGSSPVDTEMDLMHHGEIDWNAVPGPSLDFDQWLQYPAEGVNDTDETFMGMFGTETDTSLSEKGLDPDWLHDAPTNTGNRMDIDMPDMQSRLSAAVAVS